MESPTSSKGLTTFQRRGAGLAIVVIVGLQAVTSLKLVCPPKVIEALLPLRVGCPPTLWPFTDYPMYQRSYGPGNVLPRHVLVAELAAGGRRILRPEDFDLTPRRFRRDVLERVLREQRGAVQPFAQRCNATFGTLAALVVEDHPVRIADGGLETLPVEVVLRLGLDEQGRMR